MQRATTLVRKAALRTDALVDSVVLDHAARSAAGGSLRAEGGLAFDLALTRPAVIEDGDALRLEDGRLVGVRAAPEALLEVRAENPARLMRLAWQLGGSHVAAEIAADVLFVPDSPATAELIRGQGCKAVPVTRAFRPEREAHDHSTCGHDHDGHQGHAHAETPRHSHHDHDHAHHTVPHVHGPGCSHDH